MSGGDLSYTPEHTSHYQSAPGQLSVVNRSHSTATALTQNNRKTGRKSTLKQRDDCHINQPETERGSKKKKKKEEDEEEKKKEAKGLLVSDQQTKGVNQRPKDVARIKDYKCIYNLCLNATTKTRNAS